MLLVSCIACYKLFVSVRVYFYLLLLRNLLRIFNNVSFDNFLTLNQFFSKMIYCRVVCMEFFIGVITVCKNRIRNI